ncbi:unnamed protein product [Echinostoma caproni]|uniref:SWIM-type domain-containing protein n=1 Tax=Echinostoma caproni TaxID=27848 RepID=A0A183AG65_9TREM|nr:unnamed protein product [Echinostoma caproni]
MTGLVTTFLQEEITDMHHIDKPSPNTTSSDDLCWWKHKTKDEIKSCLRKALKRRAENKCTKQPRQEPGSMCEPDSDKMTPDTLSQILSDPYAHVYYFLIDCRLHPQSQAYMKRTVPGAISLAEIFDSEQRISKRCLRKLLRQRHKQLLQATSGSETQQKLTVLLIADLINTTHPVKNQIILEEIEEFVRTKCFVTIVDKSNSSPKSAECADCENEIVCFRLDFHEIRKNTPWILTSTKYNAHARWVSPPLKLAEGKVWLWQDAQSGNSEQLTGTTNQEVDFGSVKSLIKRYNLDCILVLTIDPKAECDRWKFAKLKRSVVFVNENCLSDAKRFFTVIVQILNFLTKPDDTFYSDTDTEWLAVRSSQSTSRLLITDLTANDGPTFCLGLLMLLLPCSFSNAYFHFTSSRPHPNRNFVNTELLQSLNVAILESCRQNLFSLWKISGKKRSHRGRTRIPESTRTNASPNCPSFHLNTPENDSFVEENEEKFHMNPTLTTTIPDTDRLYEETLERLEQFKVSSK